MDLVRNVPVPNYKPSPLPATVQLVPYWGDDPSVPWEVPAFHCGKCGTPLVAQRLQLTWMDIPTTPLAGSPGGRWTYHAGEPTVSDTSVISTQIVCFTCRWDYQSWIYEVKP